MDPDLLDEDDEDGQELSDADMMRLMREEQQQGEAGAAGRRGSGSGGAVQYFELNLNDDGSAVSGWGTEVRGTGMWCEGKGRCGAIGRGVEYRRGVTAPEERVGVVGAAGSCVPHLLTVGHHRLR